MKRHHIFSVTFYAHKVNARQLSIVLNAAMVSSSRVWSLYLPYNQIGNRNHCIANAHVSSDILSEQVLANVNAPTFDSDNDTAITTSLRCNEFFIFIRALHLVSSFRFEGDIKLQWDARVYQTLYAQTW